MEAVPKLPLISFELKTSPESTHFGPKLKQYIAEAYREDPDSYSNEMHQLEGLRSAAVRPLIDSAGLSAMTRYFCQLRAMQSRFPMAKGQPAACTFVWRDIYANSNSPLADIRYEMACILYNIGALLTQLAASEPRTSPESLKAACTHYQNAAWAFLYLREHYPQPPGGDMSTDIMRLLQEICFAQAQECILDKSIQDTKKPSVVGAVATQVMFFYRNSLALLGPSTGSDNIHEIIGTKLYNYWYRYLSFKLAYIGCIVCLYQGMHAEEQQKMGERVAFYQQAAEKLNDARKLTKYIEPVQITQEALTFTNDVVEGKRKAAKNENEFIYHEEVPEKDLLVDLKPVCLVKALPINLSDPEVSGPDVFSRLVPIGAHEASSVYSEEKAKLLRHVVSMAESKNTEILEFMSSLQLDQLEVLDSDQKIPQEIVDRCAAMNAKTEIIQTLGDSMNNLAEIISDVEHSLAEIKSLIQEETAKEKEYQKVMGPRPPSIVQTELSREFHKYQEAHTRTNESNQVLHKAMTLHIANLKLLAQPLDVLQSKIPSIDNIEGLDRETMMEMRRVVGKAREMQSQRETLIQQLRDDITSDDITSVLLSRASDPAEVIFKQELEKHTPKVKIIEQNLAAQENIINRLTSLYAAYGESRRLLSDVLRKREGLINALITSYDSYEELLGKSQKGLEFYKKLSLNVNQLLTRLRGTCQVQQEEREQLLSKHTTKAPTPVPPTSNAGVKVTDVSSVPPAPSPAGGSLKLKDYLPYMKNRGLARSVTPQAQIDPLPTDTYYPETIYPTSVRPAPLGSEATDLTQMKLTDGMGMPPMQNPYGRYGTPYSSNETDPHVVPSNYAYPATSKPFDKPEDMSYGYSTAYTPSQYSSQMSDPQYSNPYYSATQNSTTLVTDSQNTPYSNSQMNVGVSQFGYTDSYGAHANQMGTIPEAASSASLYNANQYGNPADLSSSFAQMQVQPKQEPQNLGGEYAKTYYSVHYPQTSTPNMATYSHTMHGSATSVVPSQVPSDYSGRNPFDPTNQHQISTTQNINPYGIPGQANPVSNAYSMPEQAYSYPGTTYDGVTQGYTIYTSSDSGITLTTTASNVVPTPANLPQEYAGIPEQDKIDVNSAALAQLDAMDQPIKSHVTGEALSTNINYPLYQNYDQTTVNYISPAEQSQMPNYHNQTEQNIQPNQTSVFSDNPTSINYAYTYQNHPGYTFNSATGNYDYSYGSQNSFTNYGNPVQPNLETPSISQDQIRNPQGVYTSAGNYETVQSPSENPQMIQQPPTEINNQNYYNSPYGYVTTNNQSSEVVRDTPSVSTNYGADMNQSTYMQSGTGPQGTSVTYISSNQVSTPKENVIEPPNFQQNIEIKHTHNDQNSDSHSSVVPSSQDVAEMESVDSVKTEQKDLSVIDLLSDIDFSVEYKPLTPEIKVPQISESAIKRPSMAPKPEPAPKPVVKEEVIERPAKVDLFSDPSLLNNFTQQVKNLQKLTETLTNKVGALTVLDSKWKSFQEVQAKENLTRTKNVATKHTQGNIVTEVVPFDDSRLTLKSDPDAYINASYFKQLAPWCIPLVISSNPSEKEYEIFWKAVLENKISCVACLLSEIEMQGKSYWPTAKGQALSFDSDLKVTLDDVTCTVHWTERKLTVTSGKAALKVAHYQINVFPAKIVCSPLVLLADKILSQTYDNRLSNQLSGALIQCSSGAGRSSVVALLLMAMCQVRAGQQDLCDMLDAACISLYKHRTNVLEDTKYLADAYRTVLFYVQGVLCSGTTKFNGEAVTLPNSTFLPPVTSSTNPALSGHKHKFSRESFEEMKQAPGLKSGDMKDPLNFLDPLWSLKKK